MRHALLVPPLLALLAATPGLAAEEHPLRQITVTGAATISATPDVATISGGVETQAPTAAEALRMNSDAMTKVLDALAKAGIAKADIQTTRLSLDPVWQQLEDGRQGNEVTGYAAGNMVTITVRDTGQLGGVIDAMAGAGGNRIYGIGFAVDDPRAQLGRAREEAVADARAKAETLAKSAGVTLGPVLRIDEGAPSGQPAPMRARMEMAAAPVSEGSIELGAEVTITYALR